MRADLPSGTVTFLFTDVEGSTKLLHALGAEGYSQALAEHRRVIREACATQGGVEVDTQGDAFFFAFPSAQGALAAAEEMTEALAAGPTQVRVGLHTGSPLLTPEGYIGDDVHFGARVAASSHGGQVVLSQATREQVDESFALSDLGEHRLKDIAEAVPIYQLGDGSFPPLKTISNTNLPRPASSFLGREAELSHLLAKIEAGARLVTLTGPGGTGKTRLALEAAATLVPSFKAGVFWVGLASLRDPALVSETISQTLGAKDGLAEHIAERELLLLLDNLEQVIEAAPALSELLQACPNLTLLVTSRELLRISGEVEYPVPPLASQEAIALFCERAQLEASPDVAELCRRLDSLPLAVELAAARTKALSPAQILERLSSRLDLLKGGRDADPRQQTLRATIEWSYDLLTPEEQQLFSRLSVFSGGCTLEAAEEVCDASLDTLQSLVEKSLLRFTVSETGSRYWMLETIREYAEQTPGFHSDQGALRERHVQWLLALAASAEPHLHGADQSTWLRRLDAELDNVRAVVARLVGVGDPRALDLVSCVCPFMDIRGHWIEGRRWVDAALAADGAKDRRRGRALIIAGTFARHAHEFGVAERLQREALDVLEQVGNSQDLAWGHQALAAVALERGDYENAETHLGEAAEHLRLTDAPGALANLVGNRADLALRRGDYSAALDLGRDALDLYRTLERDAGIGWCLYIVAICEAELGRLTEAAISAREALPVTLDVGDNETLVWLLVLTASMAQRANNGRAAAVLLGSADALAEPAGMVLSGAEEDLRKRLELELVAELGGTAFSTRYEEGRRLALGEAVDLALTSID